MRIQVSWTLEIPELQNGTVQQRLSTEWKFEDVRIPMPGRFIVALKDKVGWVLFSIQHRLISRNTPTPISALIFVDPEDAVEISITPSAYQQHPEWTNPEQDIRTLLIEPLISFINAEYQAPLIAELLRRTAVERNYNRDNNIAEWFLVRILGIPSGAEEEPS
jgi:hypothetical protein